MLKNISVTAENKIKLDKAYIHKICSFIKNELGVKIDALTINFVLQDTMSEINKKYLDHSGSTDIITFDYSEDIKVIDAELFISVADARENAATYGCTLESELLRLVIHGFLHVTGYDDLEEEDRNSMKAVENRLTEKFDHLTKQQFLSYEY